jgi:SAM-dependent methyltransferase
MVELYRDSGLDIYEKAHYSHGEHIGEVEQILTWYLPRNTRVLDVGCSGGLHALEFASRGFLVTGFDIEPSATSRAEKRAKDQKVPAEFRALDLEKDGISSLGTFDLVYSIGNVMSHLRKDGMNDALRKIRACLDESGLFLFDVFINATPFREEVYEEDLGVVWKRKLNEQTGRMTMDGAFLAFGVTQHFQLWAYTVAEISELLKRSGFTDIDFSDQLDFSSSGSEVENPVCLNFRASTRSGFKTPFLAGSSILRSSKLASLKLENSG